MKALILLPLFLCLGYFTWRATSRHEKSVWWRAVRRHTMPLLLILIVTVMGVWVAVNFASLQFL